MDSNVQKVWNKVDWPYKLYICMHVSASHTLDIYQKIRYNESPHCADWGFLALCLTRKRQGLLENWLVLGLGQELCKISQVYLTCPDSGDLS